MDWIRLLKAIGISLVAAVIVALMSVGIVFIIDLKITVEAMIGVIFVVCVVLVYGHLK